MRRPLPPLWPLLASVLTPPQAFAARGPATEIPVLAYAAPAGDGCGWFEAAVSGGEATLLGSWAGACQTFDASSSADGAATLLVSGPAGEVVLVRRGDAARVLPSPTATGAFAVSWAADGTPWAYTGEALPAAEETLQPALRITSWRWTGAAWQAAESVDASREYDTLPWSALPAWKAHVGWHGADHLNPGTLPGSGAASRGADKALRRDLPDVLDASSDASWWTFDTDAGPVAVPVESMTDTFAREPTAMRVAGTWTALPRDDGPYDPCMLEVRGPWLVTINPRGTSVIDLRTREVVWSGPDTKWAHFVR